MVWLTADATKRPGAVKAGYLWALDTALCKYGIEVPYPQRDLNVRSLFGLEGESALALLSTAEVSARIPRPARVTTPATAPAAARPADEEAPPALGEHERAQLAKNDALEEVERAAREDEQRREAEEREAAALEAEELVAADKKPASELTVRLTLSPTDLAIAFESMRREGRSGGPRLRSLRRGGYSPLPPDIGLTPRGPSRSSPRTARSCEGTKEHMCPASSRSRAPSSCPPSLSWPRKQCSPSPWCA